ncbi:ParM [Bacillus phage vB_BcgM]|nr:ParM [Bacillus phage vB_BcgM]
MAKKWQGTNVGLSVGAVDDGFGDVKCDNNGHPFLIPSFVTNFKQKPSTEFVVEGKQLEYIACEIDGKKYVVGDYATKLDPDIEWTGGENKHNDNKFPIIMKTVLGLMSKGTNETIYTLMMNLPIKNDTQERREQLTKLVQGTHEMKISYDGINFIERTVTVEDVCIKKQPFGSLCDLMLDNNGEIVDHNIAKGFNVLADIGARTLNVLTLDSLEEQPELTTHTNMGMFSSYLQIGKYLENHLGATIPDGKLPMIIQNKEIKGMDITPVINQAYENHANTILNTLDRILINSWAFVDTLIFTGGGSELLKQYLSERFAARGVKVMFLDRYANVRGLRKYGVRMAAKAKKSTVTIKVGTQPYISK